MPVEIEHIFKPVGKKEETSEVTRINPGPYQTLKIMAGLRLDLKCTEAENGGELNVGNRDLPQDWLLVKKYPNRTAQLGAVQDVHSPIIFSGEEVIEVTSKMYDGRIKIYHLRPRPSAMGYMPPQPRV